MNKAIPFPAWAKTDCAECGCKYQVTRTEPKDLLPSECLCEGCTMYAMGLAEGLRRVAELELQLRVARREAILEAAFTIPINTCPSTPSIPVYALVDYANKTALKSGVVDPSISSVAPF